MESDVKNPTWKMIGGYIFVIALLVFIALMMSCGTRRVDENTQKNSESNKTEQSLESKKESESNVDSQSKSSQQNDKTEENTETTTTTKFNDSGKPIETTTTTKTGKVVDKTKYRNKTTLKVLNRLKENLRTRDITRNVKTTIYRTRYVERNSTWVENVGGKGVLFGLGSLAIAAVFLYFYLRKK